MTKRDLLRRRLTLFDIEDIKATGRRRPLDQAKVEMLKESIARIGLMTPITVYEDDDEGAFVLVAGAHRMEAMRQLGETKIVADFLGQDDPAVKLWEISENLHRADLTAMERDRHIAEWIRLTGEQRVSRQVGAKLSTRGRPEGGKEKPAQVAQVSAAGTGGRGKRGGISAAARELNIDREDVRRALKVDSLTPEAKAAARETGLDDNRSALLQAAKAPPERQAATIRDIARSKAPRRKTKPDAAVSEPLAALRRDWERAGPEDRQAFLAEIKATDGAG